MAERVPKVEFRFFEGHCLRIDRRLREDGKAKYFLYRIEPKRVMSARTPLSILAHLTEHAKDRCYRYKIIGSVDWPIHRDQDKVTDKDATLTTHINSLRRFLDDLDRDNRKFIETVEDEGYRFMVSVEPFTDDKGEKQWRDRGFASTFEGLENGQEWQPGDDNGTSTVKPATSDPESSVVKGTEVDEVPTQRPIGEEPSAAESHGAQTRQDTPVVRPAQRALTPFEIYVQRQLAWVRSKRGLSARDKWIAAAALLFLGLCVAIIIWAFFHKTRREFFSIASSGAVRGILGFLIFLLLEYGWVKHRSRQRRKKLLEKERKLSIYVAQIRDDFSNAKIRERVIASIRKELDADVASILSAEILLGVSDDIGDEKVRAAGRNFLRENGGDLLIYGAVYEREHGNPQIDLRFVSADHHHLRPELFGFTHDRFLLDAKFGPELALALVAVASSRAADVVEGAGQYVLERMKHIASRLESLLRGSPRMRDADRAILLDSYGLVQLAVGQQTRETDRLEKALNACREASKQRHRESAVLHWADLQFRIGTLLVLLGSEDQKADRVNEGIEILREVVKALAPFGFAAQVKVNLGCALMTLNQKRGGTEGLEDAVVILKEASEQLNRESNTLRFAAVANLGFALAKLGERQSGTARLEEAVEVLRSAATKETRLRAPAAWAAVHLNLGLALTRLGVRQESADRLVEALNAFEAAAEECTRDRDPINWGLLQINIASTLRRLEQPMHLEDAIRVVRAGLEECTQERVPLYWATGKVCLGLTLASQGEQEGNIEYVKQAVEAYKEALEELTLESAPFEWGRAKLSLGCALIVLGEAQAGTDELEEAIAALSDASTVCTTESDPLNHEVMQKHWEWALALLAQRRSNLVSTVQGP
jgi:tetratricopeptide (TPR) repeat protein/DNA-binding winged helix-turn-helix (wHTH) protein